MKEKIRAAVVGTGHMGQYHVALYSEMNDVDIVGIVDISKERVDEIAARYSTTGYTDYREIIDKIDVVTIAVPTSLHYEVAKPFLERGVHVLLEKPVAKTLEEATELFQIAEKNNAHLQVGHVERFNGAVQEIKKVIKDPLMLEFRRVGPFTGRITDAGVVMDIMIHDIDIALNLIDSKVKSLKAVAGSAFTDMEDYASCQLLFENGCLANFISSRATQEKIRTMSLSQKDAYVFLDFNEQDIQIHRQASSKYFMTKEELTYRQESMIERIFVHKGNPLKLEIEHFLDCAMRGAKRQISAENELRSLKIALRVLDQIKQEA
ncbi:MAG: Gfo/Idh/MocA family oxidoreductase [bacterium]|nr:Gfo/Idh/MocA family oxidoreductase [bacterium]